MAAKLKGSRGKARILGSQEPAKSPSVPAEPKKKPDPKTYSGRVAIRLRSLRESKGWSGAELKDRLKQAGRPVPLSNIYAYELGSSANGVDVPLDLLPFYATAFGLKTPNGVLPAE